MMGEEEFDLEESKNEDAFELMMEEPWRIRDESFYSPVLYKHSRRHTHY